MFALRLEVDLSIVENIQQSVTDTIKYYQKEITRVKIQRNEYESSLNKLNKRVEQLMSDNKKFADYINMKNK